MRFTEHELTVGLAGAAKYALGLQNREVRRGKVDIEDLWNSMDKFSRWQVLDGLSDQVLPSLIALPDIEIASGHRAEYSDAQIRSTVEEVTGQVVGRLQRAATLRARIDLVKAALAAMPVRQDPDAFVVPDDLGGL